MGPHTILNRSNNWGPLELKSHAPRVTERVSVCIQRLSFNLAGDQSGPNSFFHDLAVSFDRVVEGQKTILVSRFHIAHVHDDRAFISCVKH